MKYYMNNPCSVIREINGDFSEVQVFPKFVPEELSGSDFCMGCQAGHMDGTPNHHTCGDSQEIIDSINDEEASMIVVVENRLLQDEPVEVRLWKQIVATTKSKAKERDDTAKEHAKLSLEIREMKKEEASLVSAIDGLNSKLIQSQEDVHNINQAINSLRNKQSQLDDSISIGGVALSITSRDIREMLKSKIILESLEAGGVDNWEWYGESMPKGDVYDLVDAEIKSFKVTGIS